MHSLIVVLLGLAGFSAGQVLPEFPFLKNSELLLKPSSSIILTLRDPLTPVLNQFSTQTFANREDRINAVVSALKTATETSQAPVLALLKPFGVEATPYWITNQIHIKTANPILVRFLTGLRQLKEIADEILLPLLPVFNPIEGKPPNGTEWGVVKIQAPKVWESANGNNGTGVIVAGIDTGVRGTHNALKDNFVGLDEYGWFDPTLRTPRPNDGNGHGTHTMATICGTTGTGVAPGAKWMACKGCNTMGCSQSALLACGQFITCPTDAMGRNANCSKAPHIVSNSWGGNGGQTWYNDVIAAWKAAGIVPFFAIGNEGPNCGTAGSPGDQDDVMAVGSTNINDTLSNFSSRGPRKANDGKIKPEISAPGENINSAYHTSDNAYRILSGTSMACPHTAGAAALLMSRNNKLTLKDFDNYFLSTTDRELGSTGKTCGVRGDGSYPNDSYGHGRLNVFKAFNQFVSTSS